MPEETRPSPNDLPTTALPSARWAGGRPPARHVPPASLGRIGRYDVLGELGRGGMGVVYRAADPALRRLVAIKLLLDPSRAGPAEIARFGREAEACARLRHPGIVSVFETGAHEGRPYLVMELVSGESLEALLGRGPLPPRKIAEIVRGVALALEHAHSQGVVHRDVKPENVIVDAQGAPHLMDFGLARDENASARLTATGAVLGTPAYMAPEQASGEPGEQGPHTDVYALGGVLYRALAGRPPFQAPSPQALLYQVMFKEPVPPRKIEPGVPPDLETIALRCLSKEKERRLSSAREVADELGRYLDGVPILARPIGALERARVWLRRNRKLVRVLLALALISGALVAFLSWKILELRESEAEKETRLRAREEQDRKRAEDARRRSEAKKLVDEGAAKANAHDLKGAIASFTRAIELDPRSGVAWLERGVVRSRGGDYDGGIADATRALEIGGGNARALLARGEAYLQKGDLAQAISDLSRSIAEEPTNATAWGNRGLARKKFGDLKGALEDMTRAVELDPKKVVLWRNRGIARQANHDGDGAVEDFTRAIEVDPGAKDCWTARANARWDLGDRQGALDDFARALALDPRDTVTLANRANLRGALQDWSGAIADFTAAIELDSKQSMFWADRGHARLEKGEIDGAIADLSHAIDLDPTLGRAWLVRGSAREQKGDLQGAADDFERVLQLVPDYPQAAEVRKAIEDHRRQR
ncbi:tetratricopeptide repeat protein [bacterium]|nr:tetratricopeptide repeat protein [bacterium]